MSDPMSIVHLLKCFSVAIEFKSKLANLLNNNIPFLYYDDTVQCA